MTENTGTPAETPGSGYAEQQAAAPPPYGQQQYPPPPPYQYQQPFAPYGVPDHPKATTALVLGLVGLVGGLLCGLPVLVSPFAWAIGVKARREIRQANGQLGGDGSATAGMVLGIIGTVLLTLMLIGIVVLVIVAIHNSTGLNDTTV